MRKHHLLGVVAVAAALGGVVGLLVASDDLPAAGLGPDDRPSWQVHLVNRCGEIAETEHGVPLMIDIRVDPPPIDEMVRLDVAVDGGSYPVPATPPYLHAYLHGPTC